MSKELYQDVTASGRILPRKSEPTLAHSGLSLSDCTFAIPCGVT